MKVLIIYAHPDPESFNHAILEQIKCGLKNGNHEVQIIDLYAENFNPVLRYDRNSNGNSLATDNETENYRILISQADHLIFVYPVWWYNVPAILKGFFDRVLVSGFAYTNEGKIPKGLLVNKSAWAVYTIDSPSWFVKLFRRSIEWKVIKDSVLQFCGIKNVRRLMFANVKNSTSDQRKRWLEYLYQEASKLRG